MEVEAGISDVATAFSQKTQPVRGSLRRIKVEGLAKLRVRISANSRMFGSITSTTIRRDRGNRGSLRGAKAGARGGAATSRMARAPRSHLCALHRRHTNQRIAKAMAASTVYSTIGAYRSMSV